VNLRLREISHSFLQWLLVMRSDRDVKFVEKEDKIKKIFKRIEGTNSFWC
jgi:hypothetical protein